MPRTTVKLGRQRLDAAGVVVHVRDLAATASQLEVRIKSAGISEAAGGSLEALAHRLIAGDFEGLQIRFFADHQWWSDTLLRAGDHFRLVRMREGD